MRPTARPRWRFPWAQGGSEDEAWWGPWGGARAPAAPCPGLACRVTAALCRAVPSSDPFQLRRPQAADEAAGSSPCQVVEVSAKS